MPSSEIPPLCAAPDRHPHKPRHAIPPGTTDCHCHIFEDSRKYPLSPGRSYTPPLCTADDYLAMCEALGIERTVQVNASVYGYDNSVTLDLIGQLGQHRARGVAGVPVTVSDKEIAALHRGGMRGMRLSTSVKGYGGMELIEPMSAKVKPYGWHVQLHVRQSSELAQLEERIVNLPSAVVFDHLGSTRGGEGIEAPGFKALLHMLKSRDDFWVKISSWYRRSDAPPSFDDMKLLAQALVAARADRCVWGTNWPHPKCDVPMPNDGDLIDQFCDWVPDETAQRKILVENPARLYGFN